MDPVSHAALGRTLLGLTDARPRRAVAAASILGALSPDVDAVLMPFGWDRYLRVHELGTHSLAGAVVTGLLTAALLRRLSRAPWRPLAYTATASAVSHTALDLISSARLRLLWPFSDGVFTLPLVAMADPWLAAILIAAAVVVVARPAAARRLAGAGLFAAVMFLGAKGGLAVRAQRAYDSNRGPDTVSTRMMEARWASITEWQVVDRTVDRLRVWRTNAVSGRTSQLLSWPVLPPSDLVSASMRLESVRNFHAAHPFGFAATIERPPSLTWVLWSDVRYCWRAGVGSTDVDLTVDGPGGRIACALWFGGEFDGRAVALRELVIVFGITQTRKTAGAQGSGI